MKQYPHLGVWNKEATIGSIYPCDFTTPYYKFD